MPDTPLTQRRLDEEPGLLRHPAGGDVARFAAPLDELDARRRDGPPADRPDCGGGDAAVAGARIDPVPDLGRAGPAQAQAHPAQPGGSGSILGDELRPAAPLTASNALTLDVGLRIFEPVRRGNLHEALQRRVLRYLVDPGDVGGGERAQRQPPGRDRLPVHDSSLPHRARWRASRPFWGE